MANSLLRGAALADFIRYPARWPRRPVLPVARRAGRAPLDLECGCMFEAEGGGVPPVVFMVNLFELMTRDVSPDDVERRDYASIDHLVEDGWYTD